MKIDLNASRHIPCYRNLYPFKQYQARNKKNTFFAGKLQCKQTEISPRLAQQCQESDATIEFAAGQVKHQQHLLAEEIHKLSQNGSKELTSWASVQELAAMLQESHQ